jgi:hypothetical protein
MSVAQPQAQEVFQFMTVKYHSLNPSETWINTYEFRVEDPTGVDSGALSAIAAKLITFEKTITSDKILFDSTRVSTWLPEAEYDPESFVLYPASGMGHFVHTSDGVGLEMCLYIRRQTQFGRQGRLYMRGVLDEAQIEAEAGSWRLAAPPSTDTMVQDALTSSGVAAYLPGGDLTDRVSMVMAGKSKSGVVTVRQVQSLDVAGIALRKLTRNRRRTSP